MAELSAKLATLDPANRSALADKLRQAKDKHLTRAAHAEPIAVLGIGCRFPGGASTPERFWRLLMARRSGVGRVPAERFPAADYYDPDPNAPGAIISDRGAFINEVDQFDAAFFGVSPREARRLDPQHRLLLEVTWEALENAGLCLASIRDAIGGVFIGLMGNDYFSTVQDNPDEIDAYTSTGTHYSFAANRLSFHLDLKGPSMAIDTACSSSLVALHQACQSLRARECDVAVAGGANLILTPALSISYSKWGMLSPDGCCKTFDASANGFVRGEGVGVVVLKRLDDALTHGDPVLAVVRGSAVNQDGATSVITAPSGLAQQAVIRRALKVAGVEPAAVGYVEAHGTGTSLGDPIEVEALKETYGNAPGGLPCMLGAVKTNVGHLEGAAGIAGFIKAVLAVHHGAIPPNLNFQALNPLIRIDDSRLRLANEAKEWSTEPQERFAAVSSFGAGGTNAHVILQGHSSSGEPAARPPGPAVVCLSAKSATSLKQQAARLRAWLDDGGRNHGVHDIAYTALRRRNHFEHRVAFTVESSATLGDEISEFLSERASPRWIAGTGNLRSARPVFVFSGQGSQWPGMGRALLARNPRFAAEIAVIDESFSKLAGWSIAEVLSADTDFAAARLNATAIAQPCLFALQMALVASLDELGVRPAAVVGHSVGEIAAACVAGVLDRTVATKLVFHRARLMQRLTGGGKMVAVGLSPQDAMARIRGDARLALAAVNGPRSVVLAGEAAPLEALVQALRDEGVFTRILPVDYAFHSPQIDAITGEFQNTLDEIFGRGARMAAPQLPMISTAIGAELDGSIPHATYWTRNMRATVAFEPAIATLLAQRHDAFLEIGAHPVLSTDLRESFKAHDAEARAIATLRRDQPQDLCLEAVPAALYAAGMAPDTILGSAQGALVPLPNYAWEHHRYWVKTRSRSEAGWAYDLAWDEVPRPRAVRRATSWLLLGASAGLASALGEHLRATGDRVRDESIDALRAVLASGGSATDERIERWLEGGGAPTGAPPDVIVYAPTGATVADEHPDQQAQADCATLLQLVQALERRGVAKVRTIWIATCGAQGVVEQEPVNPFGAPLWGLGRVLALEIPSYTGGLVDLPLAWSSHDVELAAEVMRHPGDEDQLAIRDGRYRALRLHRRPVSGDDRGSSASWQLDSAGVYLITGGTRGLGLLTAKRLAQRGARRLVLVGRQPLPPRSRWSELTASDRWFSSVQAIRALEEMGAIVTTYAADVSDRAALGAVFAELERQPYPLKGVVHAAGISREVPLAEVDGALLAETLSPKVAGSWWLHQLTLTQPLEFFIVFSSAAAVWGSSGLAAYAAANEFLNAIAAHRRAHGLPALSVCWGMWDADGMATDHMRQSWTRLGVHAMDPERALNLLEELAGSRAVVATVADVRWGKFRPVYELRRRRPLLAALEDGARAPAAGESGDAPVERTLVRAEIAQLPPEQQRERLLAVLRDTAASVLDLERGSPINTERGLFAMGFDSLTAVEFTNQVNHLFATSYSATLIIDHPTLRQVRDFILQDCFGWAAEPREAPSRQGDDLGALLALVESMDDDEAGRLLQFEQTR